MRQFLLNGDDGADPGQVLKLPGSAFAVSDASRSMTLRRVWLDTFDWRLYQSGLTLEQVSRAGITELALTGRDGAVLASDRFGGAAAGSNGAASNDAGSNGAGSGRPSWPGLLDALPLGPLRDQLSPVVGVRALLPVARAVSVVREARVLNSDEKTVARITVDRMSVRFPAAAAVPTRVAVSALRGYQGQALRVADLLAAAPGVSLASQSGLEAALAAGDRRPGDYSSKISVRLSPRMPASAAMVALLTGLFDTLLANVSGTVRDLDTEFLHDLRIAVRRTRSALKLAGDVLPGEMASRFRPEFKWLGDLTTPTRDLDVYLLGYPDMAAGLIAATAEDLQPFHAHLERSRGAAQRQLARGLRSARFARLRRDWADALADAAARPGAGGARAGAGRAGGTRLSAARLAASRIGRAHRRVLRDGGTITATSAPENLHDLRKRCKELRYLLEFFGSLYDPGDHWRAVRELKALQDCLGEFQDAQVQREEIGEFAAQMMDQRSAPAATLLAMGEIAAVLAAEQQRARGEFAGRFRDFASPAGQSRFRALTGTAAA
ncbi:MAG TPA: CHAD domain-containing protein [Streptosporangiaceae bacterium]|nr:CHAD domain-containing protein [Streptosporangiaceae bacterium]